MRDPHNGIFFKTELLIHARTCMSLKFDSLGGRSQTPKGYILSLSMKFQRQNYSDKKAEQLLGVVNQERILYKGTQGELCG